MHVNDLRHATFATIVWNGHARHLAPDAGFRSALALLLNEEHIGARLIVPGSWALRFVTDAIGTNTRWEKSYRSSVQYSPSMLFISGGKTVLGYTYDENSHANEISLAEMQQLATEFQ